MKSFKISKVWIDASNRLCIKPQKVTFEQIYRSATGVQWNFKERFLYSQSMLSILPTDWYLRILSAVESEYGCHLIITKRTKWDNIDESLKQLILEEIHSPTI